jgi:hypothetical protein
MVDFFRPDVIDKVCELLAARKIAVVQEETNAWFVRVLVNMV